MVFLVLLLPIGVALLMLAVAMFTLHAWARALVDALDTKFISAGVWMCVGVFMLNALSGGWCDLTGLYVAIMVGSVGAAIVKLMLRLRASL
jgi:hypothetical protein